MISGRQASVLRAVVDRVIPRDDFASGVEAGVDQFIAGLLDGDSKKDAAIVAAGLDALDARGFLTQSPAAQDQMLKALEGEKWFERIVDMCMEGFYGDPGNGGNKDEASWKMIGYDPGRARK